MRSNDAFESEAWAGKGSAGLNSAHAGSPSPCGQPHTEIRNRSSKGKSAYQLHGKIQHLSSLRSYAKTRRTLSKHRCYARKPGFRHASAGSCGRSHVVCRCLARGWSTGRIGRMIGLCLRWLGSHPEWGGSRDLCMSCSCRCAPWLTYEWDSGNWADVSRPALSTSCYLFSAHAYIAPLSYSRHFCGTLHSLRIVGRRHPCSKERAPSTNDSCVIARL